MRKLLPLTFLFAFACGGGGDMTGVDTETESEALRCSERAPVSNGVAMSVGCAFVQQGQNIRTNGQMVDLNGVELTDANGVSAGKITHVCAEWLLGEDPSGATIVISKDTGEVRSHGTLHSGQSFSALPSTLALPLSY